MDFANDLSGNVPLLHPSVTTLQVEAFSQMANVGGDATFDTYAKQTGGVTFLNNSLAPVGGITVGESARTAGMLREAMPKRLSKREQFTEKEALQYKKNGTIGSRNVINRDEVGLVYDRTDDGNLEEQELFNIEADPGKLTKYQKRFNNATDRPTGEFVVRSEKRRMRHEDDMSRTRSTSNRAARTSDGRLDGVAYQNLRRLSATPSLPEGSQDNPSGYSNGSGIIKKAGPLREGLDAHLQARREAMPKMGLEAARANVQAALHREANESRKAWAKRKTKAAAIFVAEKMVDARLPVIHPSVTTLQVEAFSQMANVGGDATFDSCAKQRGGVTFLNKSLAPVGGITVGETSLSAGMLRGERLQFI